MARKMADEFPNISVNLSYDPAVSLLQLLTVA